MNAQKKGLGLGGQTKTLCNTFCARAKQCAMREYKRSAAKIGQELLHATQKERGKGWLLFYRSTSCDVRLVLSEASNTNKQQQKGEKGIYEEKLEEAANANRIINGDVK